MYSINTLDDVRGNTVVVYSIKTLLERKKFPKLSIMSGVMGVGKTSVANVVAKELDKSDMAVKSYNFGLPVDMQQLSDEVFSLKPMKPRAFIFEEIHSLPKSDQSALLQMFDVQSPNLYIICTTTEIHKVLRTIRSRAHVWEFRLLSEKQLARLLDDYLEQKGVALTQQSKNALLRASKGVPRDLMKNADFAIDGEFDANKLDELLGNVSDELLFSVFGALKSSPVDFVSNVESLIDEVSSSKLQAMRDFWLRFMLERFGARSTLSASMLKCLQELYSVKEMQLVSKTLLRATSDTLLLELVGLNLSLSGETPATVLGQQKDVRESQQVARIERQREQNAISSAKLSSEDVKQFKL